MVISLIAAFFLPFWLFIFSYAVLGPLHYLTEIGWLKKKRFFATGKYDFLPLAIIGIVWTVIYIFLGQFDDLQESLKVNLLGEDWREARHSLQSKMNDILLAGLVGSVVMALVKQWWAKVLALVTGFVIGIILSLNDIEGYTLIIGVLLPTLIHVYIFTGLFMLYGAMKGKSVVGFVGVVCLALCAVACFIIPGTEEFGGNGLAFENYIESGFQSLNQTIYNFGIPMTDWERNPTMLFTGKGMQIQRFIAFAYTYHYLNWFSKTTVIGWYKIPKLNLIVALSMWVGSVALYFYDYALGLKVLLLLSILHVVLEFPLNAISVVGISKGIFVRNKS